MNLLTSLTLLSCIAIALSSPVQENKRLIKTSENEPAKWLSEEEIFSLIAKKQNFVDVTDYKNYPDKSSNFDSSKSIPTTLRFKGVVDDLIKAIDRPRIEDFVREFSSFHNRYYNADSGLASQKWLFQQIQDSLKGYSGTASVKEFEHTSWLQNSIIARLEGSDSTLKSELVILGAHQDSLNLGGSSLQAPGADDNASGSVVVLETLRILVSKGIIPKRTIEFHWYAAEEVGLRGSNAVAQQYKNDGAKVAAMLNMDVVGYQASGINDVGIYTDNVNTELTQFLRVLVDGYLNYGRRDVRCGYGCSDHASWHNFGFTAAFSAEVVFHPQMHTVNDNFQNVGFTQVVEFAKLMVGFTVEMAEPSN